MSILAKIIKAPRYSRFNYPPLPTPKAFYSRYSLSVKNDGWNMAKCPFHDDKHASLSINGTHGGFICHACGVKGNMIGFYMRYHNTDFKTAIRAIRGQYE